MEKPNTVLLGQCLQSIGANKEGATAILLVLVDGQTQAKTEENIVAMLDWTASLDEAPTENEVLVKAL